MAFPDKSRQDKHYWSELESSLKTRKDVEEGSQGTREKERGN